MCHVSTLFTSNCFVWERFRGYELGLPDDDLPRNDHCASKNVCAGFIYHYDLNKWVLLLMQDPRHRIVSTNQLEKYSSSPMFKNAYLLAGTIEDQATTTDIHKFGYWTTRVQSRWEAEGEIKLEMRRRNLLQYQFCLNLTLKRVDGFRQGTSTVLKLPTPKNETLKHLLLQCLTIKLAIHRISKKIDRRDIFRWVDHSPFGPPKPTWVAEITILSVFKIGINSVSVCHGFTVRSLPAYLKTQFPVDQ